mgnify:CR=1 FL=1|jgi:hypothetical protein
MLLIFSILLLLVAIILYKFFVINPINDEQKKEIREAKKGREIDRLLSETPTWHRQSFH